MRLQFSEIFYSAYFPREVNSADDVLEWFQSLSVFFKSALDVSADEIFTYLKVVKVKLVRNIPANSSIKSSPIEDSVKVAKTEVEIFV